MLYIKRHRHQASSVWVFTKAKRLLEREKSAKYNHFVIQKGIYQEVTVFLILNKMRAENNSRNDMEKLQHS